MKRGDSIGLVRRRPSFPTSAPARIVLTDADVLVIQLSRSVAEVPQPAVLAVLASGVVLAADARDDVQVVDVAAAVGVAVALTVWKENKDRESGLAVHTVSPQSNLERRREIGDDW